MIAFWPCRWKKVNNSVSMSFLFLTFALIFI